MCLLLLSHCRYRAIDVLGLSALTRVFYVDFVLVINYLAVCRVFLCFISHVLSILFTQQLLHSSLHSLTHTSQVDWSATYTSLATLSAVNYALQIAWLALPVSLLARNVTPSRTLLILWALEQVLTVFFGGPRAASAGRLIALTTLSWCCAGGVFVLIYLDAGAALGYTALFVLLTAAGAGALLSNNLLPNLTVRLFLYFCSLLAVANRLLLFFFNMFICVGV